MDDTSYNILALVLYWRYQDKKRTPLGNDQSIVDVPCGAALASRSTANAREGGCGARAAGGEPATGTLPGCYVHLHRRYTAQRSGDFLFDRALLLYRSTSLI